MADQTPHETFVLVDPVLDYEESMTILGVYSTLAEAQGAVHALLQKQEWRWLLSRLQHVEHWQGDKCRGIWEHRPIDRSWTCIELDGIER